MAIPRVKSGKITDSYVRAFRLPGDFTFGEVNRINSIVKHSDDKLNMSGRVEPVRFKGESFFTTGSEATKKLLEEEFGIDGIRTVIFKKGWTWLLLNRVTHIREDPVFFN